MAKRVLKEGRLSQFCARVVVPLYGSQKNRFLRNWLRKIVLRMEGGAVYSLTIREIYRRFHGVSVGLYSIGPCEVEPGNLMPGTVVGRYCSIYYTVRAVCEGPAQDILLPGLEKRKHPNQEESSALVDTGLEIGNDVFIGHNVIILPSVKRIGDGAVVGAGSVLRNDIPPYAIVTGNPGRVVRFRFSETKIAELLAEKWWLSSIQELSGRVEEFRKPLEGDLVR